MPKVYLHYDGERGPDHTFMWKGGAPGVSRITGLSLAQALAAFVSSYQNKHGLEAYDGGMLAVETFQNPLSLSLSR